MNMQKGDLKNLTTLSIGGPAQEILQVQTTEDLISAASKLSREKINYLVVGGGSNLLVSDEGFPGTIVLNKTTGIKKEGDSLTVKSGTLLQELVDFANSSGLKGLEKLAGIPGTVGGAVYGNAGAYGQTISDYITQVRCHDPASDKTAEFKKDDCLFAYRDSIFKKNRFIILEATFLLGQDNPEELVKTSVETVAKREVKYPPGIKCPGSFFKNIPSDTLDPDVLKRVPPEFILFGKVSAGALLESVGAKGASLRNIKIADYHANLFINEGGGTAADFYELAKTYRQKVFDKYGISLEPEVQLINLPPLG
jgi:UDP-N-acetylmuramate dehydrogenase